MEGFIRPDVTVLSDSAMLPERNYIVPHPNQFTHVVVRPLPFYLGGADQGKTAMGEFPVKELVVLLSYEGGKYCWVANRQGLYVEVEYKGLEKLE